MKNIKLKTSQTNAEETKDNSNYLKEVHEIDNTPFAAVKQNDIWFGLMGKWKITEDKKTRKEVETEIAGKSWKTIVSVIGAIVETHENNKNK